MDVDPEFLPLQQARLALPASGKPGKPPAPLGTTAQLRSNSSTPGVQQQLPQDPLQLPLEPQHPPDTQTKVTFLLRACNGARVFSHPVSHALHTSPLGKYIIEGETRSLGNGSALVVALWESGTGNYLAAVPRGPVPWRKYGKVGPLSEEIKDLEEIRSPLRALDGSDIEVSWIPPPKPAPLPPGWCSGQALLPPILLALPFLKVGHSSTPADLPCAAAAAAAPIRAKGRKLPVTGPSAVFSVGASWPQVCPLPFHQEPNNCTAGWSRKGCPFLTFKQSSAAPPTPEIPATSSITTSHYAIPMAASPPRAVHPDVAYSSVATGNRYTVLQDQRRMMPLPGTLFPLFSFPRARSRDPDAMYDRPRQRLHPWRLLGFFILLPPWGPHPLHTEADVHHPPSFLSRTMPCLPPLPPLLLLGPNAFLGHPHRQHASIATPSASFFRPRQDHVMPQISPFSWKLTPFTTRARPCCSHHSLAMSPQVAEASHTQCQGCQAEDALLWTKLDQPESSWL
ncbi:hypothetical protein GWK47_004474 [Chionoecetes opilio]|uniref:Uncharacterized protein n=1 Tax=Chionoecetes opilio TaxID=41210 RepID=A0A8J4YLR3_CHIOP|nr:hypothetical protein GWK47_004474 [Chionoecetes opilio]